MSAVEYPSLQAAVLSNYLWLKAYGSEMNTLPMLQWNIAPFYVRGSQEAGGGLPDPSLDGECRDFRVADVYLLAGHDCACTMLVVAGQLATQSRV